MTSISHHQMNSLSDYVLATVLHRCSRVGYLSHSLKTKSYRLRRYLCARPSLGLAKCLTNLPDELVSNLTYISIPVEVAAEVGFLRRCKSVTTMDVEGCSVTLLPSLPPTLTKLNGTMFMPYSGYIENVNSVTCDVLVRLHVRLQALLGVSNGPIVPREAIISDVKTITSLHASRRAIPSDLEKYIGSSLTYNGLSVGRSTIRSLVISCITGEWIDVVNLLHNLTSLIVNHAQDVTLLYSIKAPLRELSCSISSDLMLCKLPPSITLLHLHSVDTVQLSASILCCGHSNLERLYTSLPIRSQLPSSLLVLHATDLDLNMIVGCSRLLTLNYSTMPGVTGTQWPDSITDLTIMNFNREPISIPDYLPKRLRKLALTTVVETEAMKKWDTSKVKSMTKMFISHLDLASQAPYSLSE